MDSRNLTQSVPHLWHLTFWEQDRFPSQLNFTNSIRSLKRRKSVVLNVINLHSP